MASKPSTSSDKRVLIMFLSHPYGFPIAMIEQYQFSINGKLPGVLSIDSEKEPLKRISLIWRYDTLIVEWGNLSNRRTKSSWSICSRLS